MSPTVRLVPSVLFLSLASLACGEKIEQAKAAVEMAKDMAKAAEAAEAANSAAEDGEKPETAEEALAQMGKAVDELQEKGQLSGPVVNWRDLATFLPDTLAGYSAKDDVKGKTTTMGQIEVSEVRRGYTSGDSTLLISIVDTVFSPMMRTPFNMVAMINEDSSEGYKKGTKIGGHTALVEWKEANKRSKAMVLVAGRFAVDVSIRPASSHDEAQKIAAALNLDGLSKLAPQAP